MPQIKENLENLTDSLTDLAETLPQTQAQLSDIRHAYDSGRDKVRHYNIFFSILFTLVFRHNRSLTILYGSIRIFMSDGE